MCGENISQQHKLMVADFSIQKGTKGKRKSNPKVKWWKLEKAENVELTSSFKENVLREIKLEDDVNDWWELNSKAILRHGEENLGKTSGKGPPKDNENWWWNEDTQDKIKKKKESQKTYGKHRTEETSKHIKTETVTKQQVARANAAAFSDL
ncbi:uncharacterized protein LOC135218089 [Macrobrachium nipponense]|uniref:uncharacterized protein LOC135218089 n=1 Tax=Macrobrachium nipponense TaxID=159736 RepID=UPI0030C7E000